MQQRGFSQQVEYFSRSGMHNHAIIQLDDKIFEAFENNLLRWACLLTIQKAFERVYHMVLLKKQQLYSIRINMELYKSKHGTIIRTGITCNKIPL